MLHVSGMPRWLHFRTYCCGERGGAKDDRYRPDVRFTAHEISFGI